MPLEQTDKHTCITETGTTVIYTLEGSFHSTKPYVGGVSKPFKQDSIGSRYLNEFLKYVLSSLILPLWLAPATYSTVVLVEERKRRRRNQAWLRRSQDPFELVAAGEHGNDDNDQAARYFPQSLNLKSITNDKTLGDTSVITTT